MSTRSILVLTGFSEHPPARATLRLYKHWDGYPSDTLQLLHRTLQRAQQFLDDRAQEVQRYQPDGRTPTLATMPVKTLADLAIAESILWFGAMVRLDTDWPTHPVVPRQGEPELRQAYYPGAVTAAHFGRQGDLEWVYLVDLPRQEITVWATDGTPEACLGTPATDPRLSVRGLVPEARTAELARIAAARDDLAAAGWTLTTPGTLAPAHPACRAKPSATGVRQAASVDPVRR